MKQITQRIMFQ